MFRLGRRTKNRMFPTVQKIKESTGDLHCAYKCRCSFHCRHWERGKRGRKLQGIKMPLFIVGCLVLGVALQTLCQTHDNFDIIKWKSHVLKEHNRVRKEASENLGQLEWSSTLEKYAKKYAETCKRYHSMPDYRKSLTQTQEPCGWIGENGWSGYRSSGYNVTRAFENEKRYWNFADNKCNYHWKKCGHYKQIIDPRVCKLGCGRAEKCGDTQQLTVIWCWYGINCKSSTCGASRERELRQMLGEGSVDELYEFVRFVNDQVRSSTSPSTGKLLHDNLAAEVEGGNLSSEEIGDDFEELL